MWPAGKSRLQNRLRGLAKSSVAQVSRQRAQDGRSMPTKNVTPVSIAEKAPHNRESALIKAGVDAKHPCRSQRHGQIGRDQHGNVLRRIKRQLHLNQAAKRTPATGTSHALIAQGRASESAICGRTVQYSMRREAPTPRAQWPWQFPAGTTGHRQDGQPQI